MYLYYIFRLENALGRFLEKCKYYGKNPSWWYGLPLLHFLRSLCKPCGKRLEQLNYEDVEPTWWGIASIKDAVNDFKKADGMWKM